MTLLSGGSSQGFQVGQIIEAAGPPDSNWQVCDGSILEQASYSAYCRKVPSLLLHPNSWNDFEILGKPTFILSSGAFSKMGDIVVAMPYADQDVYYSTDGGATWQETITNPLPSAGNWAVIANDGTNFITLRNGSTAGAYSSDGINWTGFTMPVSANWSFLGWNGTRFVAVSASSSVVYYSTTGYSSWNTGSSFGDNVSGIPKGHDASGYFLFHDYNYHLQKTNGPTLTDLGVHYFDEAGYLPDCLPFLNGKWWSYYEFPVFRHSSDGITWIDASAPNIDVYDNYFYLGKASFYTGEEYVFISGYDDTPHYVSTDEKTFYPRLNWWEQINDSIFISKAQGALILLQNHFSTITPWKYIARLNYTSYDYTTHFQIPNLRSNISGMHYIIKMR